MKHMLLLILFSAIACFGQTVNITDQSAPGSPVTIKGTVTFSGSNITASVIAHNSTKQDVLVNVAGLTITTPAGEVVPISIKHSHYFKPDTGHEFTPGSDLEILGTDVPHPGLVQGFPRPQPTLPHAEASLVYVELADGSSWGDNTVGADILNHRAKVRELFNNLNNAYTTGGVNALHSALAQKPDRIVATMVFELRTFEATNGTELLAQHIQQRLAAAAQRQAKMTVQ
jgi:hypothetical protein